MNISNLKIFVTTYKGVFCREEEPFVPIHVGKATSEIDLGYFGDDTGDNISERNKSLNELSAMYWVWKNFKEVDYIGFCHYRRYFYAKGDRNREIFNCTTEAFKSFDLGTPKILEYFKKYDIVLPRKRIFYKSFWDLYDEMHFIDDFIEIEKIIAELYPEYRSSFNEKIRKNNRLPQYNMFVMKWADFVAYCEWIFPIIFEAERRIDISRYDCVQVRIWGFIAEQLLGVFIHHQKLKAKYLPVAFVTDQYKDTSMLRYYGSRWRNQTHFWLRRLKTFNRNT
jgi:hypothetical protein